MPIDNWQNEKKHCGNTIAAKWTYTLNPNQILSRKGTIISGLTDEEKSGSVSRIQIEFERNKRRLARGNSRKE